MNTLFYAEVRLPSPVVYRWALALTLLGATGCAAKDDTQRVTPPPGSLPGSLGGLPSNNTPGTPGTPTTTQVSGVVCVQSSIVAPITAGTACTAPTSTTLRASLVGSNALPVVLSATGGFTLDFGTALNAYVLIDGDSQRYISSVYQVVSGGQPRAASVRVPILNTNYFETLTQTSAVPPAAGSGSVIVTVRDNQGAPLAGVGTSSISDANVVAYADGGGGQQLDANGVTGTGGTLVLLQGQPPNLTFTLRGVSGGATVLPPQTVTTVLGSNAITFLNVTLGQQN